MVGGVGITGSGGGCYQEGFKCAGSHAELVIKRILMRCLEVEWPLVARSEAWALRQPLVIARHEALAAPVWGFHLLTAQ